MERAGWREDRFRLGDAADMSAVTPIAIPTVTAMAANRRNVGLSANGITVGLMSAEVTSP